MQFEVSERVKSKHDAFTVQRTLEAQLRKVASAVQVDRGEIVAQGIEASFGSINRSDSTRVRITPKDDGHLLVAEVTYKPSGMFWVVLLLLLPTFILWLLPIVFYLTQKGTVRTAVEKVFRRVRDELE